MRGRAVVSRSVGRMLDYVPELPADGDGAGRGSEAVGMSLRPYYDEDGATRWVRCGRRDLSSTPQRDRRSVRNGCSWSEL